MLQQHRDELDARDEDVLEDEEEEGEETRKIRVWRTSRGGVAGTTFRREEERRGENTDTRLRPEVF